MKSNRQPTHSDAAVISLGPISAACRDLIAWHDAQLAEPQPRVDGLDRVLERLHQLPSIPGRLGRDIELVVFGGASTSEADVSAAIERIRQAARHDSLPTQSTLPGMDDPAERS